MNYLYTPLHQSRFFLASVVIPIVVLIILGLNCGKAIAQSAMENPGVNDSEFPTPYDSEPETAGLLTPQEALDAIKLPDGFEATLFAAEPDVQNPIAACTDPSGRLWIAENFTYAERSERFALDLMDRVVVLEDTDGDGKSDKRTVFIDDIQMLTGITVGRGGVWLMCPPRLLFVPDADGDLQPDGPPVVKLDGFHVARENYHNFANGLSWGPDGWLYGRCGASSPGELGLPGSIDADRVPMRGGIWRFHPERDIVEVLTQGTTNPWGHDWNGVGELFYINTVNGHLWHAIPGAHFVRSHTIDDNPHSYELIDMHADHWHFDTGASWTKSRDGAANDYGGGHAHIGMMIYQGYRWPKQYHGKLFTVNMHGRRINMERLEREGAGFVGRHDEDFLLSSDTWFRGMDMIPSADGNMFLIDWSDTGECHDHTGVHRSSGRVYKISFNDGLASETNLATKNAAFASVEELFRSALEGDEWLARKSREQLRQRWLSSQDQHDFTNGYEKMNAVLDSNRDPESRLRALWTLYQLQQLSEQRLLLLTHDSNEYLRSWAVRLLTDDWPMDQTNGLRPARTVKQSQAVVDRLKQMALDDSAASVRLTLASTLQRLHHSDRAMVASGLMRHAEDASDHNLPLLVWYGLTPLGNSRLKELATLISDCEWPVTRRLIARRVADQIDDSPNAAEQLIQLTILRTRQSLADSNTENSHAFASDIVLGMSDGLAGRRKVLEPAGWSQLARLLAAAKDPELKSTIDRLNVLFGSGVAVEELKRLVADRSQSLETRRSALRSLVSARAEGLKSLCLGLLRERFLNIVAAEGLATESDPEIAARLVERFRSFAPLDRPQVVSMLTTRPTWASSLLAAVAKGEISPEEISPSQARQIVNLGDPKLTESLSELWGEVRESPEERLRFAKKLKQQLTPETLASGNLKHGRELFTKNCASCHQLFGVGGKLGPDLTGAQRSNIDYLLDNIVDPSAVVTKEFRATIVLMEDGRVLTGLLISKTERIVQLATQNETFTLPVDEIEQMKTSTASTMPDGLLNQMTSDQLRDLFAYLQTSKQVTVD